MLPETPYVLYMQLQHQANFIEMVLLSIFFANESDPRRDHQQIVLYSFCLPMRSALHLAVKTLPQIFLYEDLHRWPYIHLSVVFLQKCQQDRTLLRNQYY